MGAEGAPAGPSIHERKERAMPATAHDVLATKAVPLVHTCSAATTVKEAASLMSTHRVGSLLVVEDGALRGIFTERDVMLRVVAQGRNPDTTRVGDVMTTSLITVSPETPIEELERIMRENRIRHLPVLESGKLVAMVSIGDVLVFHAESRKHMVEQLTDYVTGSSYR
jgi:CBS domain-containing protein